MPLVAVLAVVMMLFAGLVIDVGRVWVAQRQLQSAVDSASLVAGQDLPDAQTAYTDAVSYSAGSGDKNQLSDGISANAPTVTFQCDNNAPNYTAGSPPTCASDSSGKSCHPTGSQTVQPSGATTCNAVKIVESATVKTTLAGFALPDFTVSATSTAAARGGQAHPIHAYVIFDNTGSMSSSCNASVTGVSSPDKLDCAKAGVRALLNALWPCPPSLGNCGSPNTNPFDSVGMLVFPAISGNPPAQTTLNKELDCSSSSTFTTAYPNWSSYTYNALASSGGIPSSDQYSGYQAVGLSSDYRSGAASSFGLNATTSNLVKSVDWGQCPSGTYPGGDYYGLKAIGGHGSYLAGAITEAQYLLAQNSQAGITNAIIVLSDGQMT
ncbi:MAG: pilus assembly protein TadG-related protein, partial [Solirubrobacteraceae bacterium]